MGSAPSAPNTEAQVVSHNTTQNQNAQAWQTQSGQSALPEALSRIQSPYPKKTQDPGASLQYGGGAPSRVRYAGRTYLVRKEHRRSYILVKGAKVWLKDIRGRYIKHL